MQVSQDIQTRSRKEGLTKKMKQEKMKKRSRKSNASRTRKEEEVKNCSEEKRNEGENKRIYRQRLYRERDFENWSERIIHRQWEMYERAQNGTSVSSGLTKAQKDQAVEDTERRKREAGMPKRARSCSSQSDQADTDRDKKRRREEVAQEQIESVSLSNKENIDLRPPEKRCK